MGIAITLTLALSAAQDLAHAEPECSSLAAPVRLIADGAPIDTGAYVGHSGPLMDDVTGDGRPELLVGNFRGHIQVFVNSSEEGAPRWESNGLLQATGADLRVPNW